MEKIIENVLSFVAQLATEFGAKLIFAALLVFVGSKLINAFLKFVCKSIWYEKIDVNIQAFIKSFVKLLLYTIMLISAAAILGIPAASLITMLASAGVAVGLALQGALSNLAGGLMILFFKPFKVGDMIEADGHNGVVSGITVFYTILTTVDNKKITLPNGSLTNSSVVNYSASPTRRVDFVFSVDYSSDVDNVKKILMDVIAKNEKVLDTPEPVARLKKHNDSSLDFAVWVWCNSEDYWSVYFDMTEQVKKAFDKNGIDIPYPHLEVINRDKE
jgi:small conductance mechanosensitive channel